MPVPRSVADVDSFITLLMLSREDEQVRARLRPVLELPDEARGDVVHRWVSELRVGGAPNELVAAIACLMDPGVAQRARATILRDTHSPLAGQVLGQLPAQPEGWRGGLLNILAGFAVAIAVLLGISAGVTETATAMQAVAAICFGVVALLLFSTADS